VLSYQDTDVFSFTAAPGTVTIRFFPLTGWGTTARTNVDAWLRVRTAAGGEVASAKAHPAATSGPSAQLSVPISTDETFYLWITPAGHMDPAWTGYSTYATAGQYAVTATFTPSPTRPTGACWMQLRACAL
jgi:hypothetical protein